ncbi:hypothetical protein [Kribbella sp. CA-293567]|uniref:hypothetical protein n=1 Tax=Kribbella sp. CA-293567 TaxID=3002436 RepID=UPI0022DD035B|nr:hypothetical protein [Kribbella sp. CA-293567]WBQ05970.1 hypothetical protein OX958_04010 [Kribbella sp. CA-293567]
MTDVRSGDYRRRDLLVFLGMPLGLAAVSVFCGGELPSAGDLIQGVSILTGLLFALVIFVFQLRLQVGSDDRIGPVSRIAILIDELFANVLYAVVVGLVTTAIVVLAGASVGPESDGDAASVNRWWTGGVVLTCSHLLLTIAMCLKRTRAAYADLKA